MKNRGKSTLAAKSSANFVKNECSHFPPKALYSGKPPLVLVHGDMEENHYKIQNQK
jgi:hypothetical protein